MTKSIAVFGLAAALIVLATCGYVYCRTQDPTTNIEQLGQKGDAFGSVNALFSGLALIGLTVTIAMQTKELQDQRLEMELQRKSQFQQTHALTAAARINAIVAIMDDLTHRIHEATGGSGGLARTMLDDGILAWTAERLHLSMELRELRSQLGIATPPRQADVISSA